MNVDRPEREKVVVFFLLRMDEIYINHSSNLGDILTLNKICI